MRVGMRAARLKVFPVPEAADDTVGASIFLYLLRAFAVACLIGQIETLGDDTVASPTCGSKPTFGVFQLQAGRRETE